MSIVAERAGQVNIRVGGNSQDTASWVESLPGGDIIAKDTVSSTNPVSGYCLPNLTSAVVLTLIISDRHAGVVLHHGLPVSVFQCLFPRQCQVVSW